MDSVVLRTSLAKPMIRQWMCQGSANFTASNFVLPLFIINNDNEIQEIPSMPQVFRYGINRAIDYLVELVNEKGLCSVLLFPVVDSKLVNDCTKPSVNPVLRLIPLIKKHYPSLYVIVDVCLCGFTSDGHCYISDEKTGKKANDATLTMLANLSVAYAQSGCDMVAPSDMNDGRVAAICSSLKASSFDDVSIMSYSAKFASNFYGPFRDAAGSAPKHGDRKSYQLTPGSSGLAMRAIRRDIEEGADIIMIKPGLPYLDIISEAKKQFPDIPRAVYHVSGEYSMLYQAGVFGCLNLDSALLEILISFKRAGAEIIITYFTPKILDLFKQFINFKIHDFFAFAV